MLFGYVAKSQSSNASIMLSNAQAMHSLIETNQDLEDMHLEEPQKKLE